MLYSGLPFSGPLLLRGFSLRDHSYHSNDTHRSGQRQGLTVRPGPIDRPALYGACSPVLPLVVASTNKASITQRRPSSLRGGRYIGRRISRNLRHIPVYQNAASARPVLVRSAHSDSLDILRQYRVLMLLEEATFSNFLNCERG